MINTGNVTIADVSVADAKCAAPPVLISESSVADGLLEPGESQTWACTSVPVTQAEVDAGSVENNASVTGSPVAGVLPPATDSHVVQVSAAPSWDVVKATSSRPQVAGDVLDYTFTVVNTGNVTITGVTVVDARCATAPAITFESIVTDGILQFGETQIWSCASVPVTQAEVDAGEVLNEVLVTGEPAGGDLDPATDDHVVDIVANPDWQLVKSTDTVPDAVGSTLDYTFELTNTGNVTITNVTLIDAKCAEDPTLISGDVDADGELDVGETWVFECESIPVTRAEMTAGVVVNQASATGSSPGALPFPAANAESITTIVPPPFPPAIQPPPEPAAAPAPPFEPVAEPASVPATTTLAHTGQGTAAVASLALTVIGAGFYLLGLERDRRREDEHR